MAGVPSDVGNVVPTSGNSTPNPTVIQRYRNGKSAMGIGVLFVDTRVDMVGRCDEAVRSNPYFADTFTRCWPFGQSDRSPNSARFDALKKEALRQRKKVRT